jgi:hypothetical protein
MMLQDALEVENLGVCSRSYDYLGGSGSFKMIYEFVRFSFRFCEVLGSPRFL